LSRLIWSSGLYAHESYVRRNIGQSPGAGFLMVSAVAGTKLLTSPCAIFCSSTTRTSGWLSDRTKATSATMSSPRMCWLLGI